jgi:hypothetical protein
LPSDLVLVGLHFLAFPDRLDRCVQREAQAMVIQGLVQEVATNKEHVIILGDVNDFDAQVEDAADSVTISGVLDFLKASTSVTALNMAQNINSQSERYSCWYDENNNCKVDPHELTMIDHLVMSPELEKYVSGAGYYHGYPGKCDSFFSDHWPVVLELNLSGMKAENDKAIEEPNQNLPLDKVAAVGVAGVVLIAAAVVVVVIAVRRLGQRKEEVAPLIQKS